MSLSAARIVRGLGRATWGKGSLKGNLLSAPASLWFLSFLLVPLFLIVAYGFSTTTQFYYPTFERMTLDHYAEVVQPGGLVMDLTLRTLAVAIATTLASAAISYPVAYFLARQVSERWRGILVSLIVIPFWVSFVVHLYAIYPFVLPDGFVAIFFERIGLQGFGDWLLGNFGYGTSSIVVPVLVYIWLPYMVLPLFTSLLKIDREYLEAAQDLGAGPWRTFWSVTFPMSFRGLVTGSVLIFITAFGSFVEPSFFAGLKQVMVGQYIYKAFTTLGTLPEGAAAASFILLVTVVMLYVYVTYSETEYATGTSRVGRLLRRLASLFARPPAPTAAGPQPQLSRGAPDGGRKVPTFPWRTPLERAFDLVAERLGKRLLGVLTLLVLVTFYVPLSLVVVYSFNSGSNVVAFESFSLKWYLDPGGGSLVTHSELLSGMRTSLIVGVASTALSLVLGTLAALALARYRFVVANFVNLMVYTGLVIPSIVLGLSLALFRVFLNDYFLFPVLGTTWEFGYGSIIIGHSTFSIPIVIIVVLIGMREFDRTLEEAAMNLGANELTTFLRVTLPVIKPSLISAALLAFTFSFDEVIVSIFTQGQGVVTMPVMMWSLLTRRVVTPVLNAASTVILVMSIVFVLTTNKLQKGGALFRI
ncbi:MAG: hypothetical protein A3K68_04245 [Euryarchaeota archaeon RBG_16_68_13]|nr:MAG: hypothetical protein A3K68_04245 [Euryarchaeota archaeon RBG_16_68_13]